MLKRLIQNSFLREKKRGKELWKSLLKKKEFFISPPHKEGEKNFSLCYHTRESERKVGERGDNKSGNARTSSSSPTTLSQPGEPEKNTRRKKKKIAFPFTNTLKVFGGKIIEFPSTVSMCARFGGWLRVGAAFSLWKNSHRTYRGRWRKVCKTSKLMEISTVITSKDQNLASKYSASYKTAKTAAAKVFLTSFNQLSGAFLQSEERANFSSLVGDEKSFLLCFGLIGSWQKSWKVSTLSITSRREKVLMEKLSFWKFSWKKFFFRKKKSFCKRENFLNENFPSKLS